MAAHCLSVMRLRTFCNIGCTSLEVTSRTVFERLCARGYRTRTGPAQTPPDPDTHTATGEKDLLLEFPDPKSLLHSALSRSLGRSNLSRYIQYNCTDGEVKRVTVTLHWPQKIETEGFGSRKLEAERRAAAAACCRLRELGVLGPGNELPRRRLASQAGACGDSEESHSLGDRAEPRRILMSRIRGSAGYLGAVEGDPKVTEALAIFPKPKALLARIVQVATASSGSKELLHYRMAGGKVKRCELTLHWPERMSFTAHAHRRQEAETRAAALACLKLKELKLLDEQNNPLTHAMYHQEEVREAGERERRPCWVEVPENLEHRIRDYLDQYPIESEVQKLRDAEQERAEQHRSSSFTDDDEDDEDPVLDTVTGKPYRCLSPEDSELLSDKLLRQWEQAGPVRGVELPVDSHRERLVEAVKASRVVVVAGETGCGKTTRIPRFLLEERVRGGAGAHCNILVTQPRRISAVSVAERVAQEMGHVLRRSVGYQVRLESRPPEASGGSLLFLTVGVLLRKLQSNPRLLGVSHVLVDEVHERDINTDLLLALLRRTLTHNPELRVVLMSASGDTRRLATYFDNCPVVQIPGFMHPVRQRYLEDVLRELGRPVQKERPQFLDEPTPDVDLVADVINHIHTRGEPGAVLCFLPGWQDIKAVQQKLEEKQAFTSGSQLILPLHSSMSVADQQTVFKRPPQGQRKIVLATNIAETSITIDDVVHVVDLGTQKEQSYDPRTKVSCLDTVWISRSNVTQRRGRAGRCQPGHAYHLFPRRQLETMSLFPIPEILRTPLESLVVQAKIYSPQTKAVDFLSQVMDSPELAAVMEAVRTLQDIGVLDRSERLTPLGERVACMSCDPRLGKLLVLSSIFCCVLPMLSVAACLTRDPFHNSLQNRAAVDRAKGALSGSSCSDYLVFSRAVQGWRELQDRRSRQEYLDSNCLSAASLRFIHGLTQQFSENLAEAELVAHSQECLRPSSSLNRHSHQEELLKALLLAGFYPNLIRVKKGTVTKGGRFRPNSLCYRTQSGPVFLHRSSVNRNEQKLPSRWLTFFSAVKSNSVVFIRDSSAAHPLAILLLTDCNLVERVRGDRVEVVLPGHSLIRWELSAQSWELLWALRTSLQALLHRKLQSSAPDPRSAGLSAQDSQLISLLVELLNRTDPDANTSDDSDSE